VRGRKAAAAILDAILNCTVTAT